MELYFVFQALPASQEDDSANGDSESDLDDDDDDPSNAFMSEVPADFELIEKPAFLPDGGAIKGAFILILLEQGWFLGKFSEYKPRSAKFKYVITLNNGPRPQQLQLSNYYEGEVEPASPNIEDQAFKADAIIHILSQNRHKYTHTRPKSAQLCAYFSKTWRNHAHTFPKPTQLCK